MDSRPSLIDRLRNMDPRVFDLVMTVGLTILGVGSQFTASVTHDEEFRGTDLLAVLLGLATTVPVYWRRVRPLPALLVSLVAITLITAGDYRTNSLPIACFFLVYGVGAYATRRPALIGLAATNLALGAIFLTDPPDLNGTAAILNMAVFSGAWLGGQVVQARAATTAARLAEAEERAEAQRQISARSVAEERLRLAQELHDVVAHSMSVIAVQAGMGVHVIDTRPADAKAALEAISATSRRTLQEMRRLLGVLRDEDGGRAHTPAPGLAELPALVEDVRSAGVPVDLTLEGDPSGVPQAVELSVYRLVQEGLTNVIKHAGTASAAVTVRCQPHEVVVEVVDDGRGAAARTPANGNDGHGLLGMRERVGLWGGTLEAGPRQGGGYRVLALLPFGEAS